MESPDCGNSPQARSSTAAAAAASDGKIDELSEDELRRRINAIIGDGEITARQICTTQTANEVGRFCCRCSNDHVLDVGRCCLLLL